MIFQRLDKFRKPLIIGLLPMIMLLILRIESFAQSESSDEPRGTNVQWSIKNEAIFITYDLIGDPGEKYDVRIIMKRENDPSFSATPVTTEGDIGEGFFAGNNRTIRWYFRHDYPQGFQGEGYYFEVRVTNITPRSTWLYYAIGGTAVVAGVIALIVSGSQSKSKSSSELPLPPERP
ncbi:MAG: hypothetical protein C0417_11660 [Chlorobiaceae bacterium]|nr:hypothetical protein [Chlorobiaceae bacterium]